MSAALESDYHPEVARLFVQLTHGGSFHGERNTVNGEAGRREQGASVRLWLRLALREHKGVVESARFEAYGCPHLLAAAESLCRWLEGRSRVELDRWNWRELETALAIPPDKRTRLLILEDALRRAAQAWDHFISAKVSATQSEM